MKISHALLIRFILLGSLLCLTTGTQVLANETDEPKQKGVKEVAPVEDLMREHGALNRVLLIYDEVIRRVGSKEVIHLDVLRKAATLVQGFIENYHEKLEEEHVFPRLKKAGKLVELTDTLFAQHNAGRKLTQEILDLSADGDVKDNARLRKLSAALIAFVVMYRPHEAREDTIVFPEFKKVVTKREYDHLGEVFEAKEHKLFGEAGFSGVVADISELEKALGIFDLNKFTPK